MGRLSTTMWLYCATTLIISLAFLATAVRSDAGQKVANLFAAPSSPATTSTPATTTATMNSNNQCNLRKSSKREKELLAIIDQFTGRNFTVDDKDHSYLFGVCVKAEPTGQADEGFVQINRNTLKTIVIGRLSDVDVEGTPYSIRMVYKNGDKYPNSCNRTSRSAVIYFICAPTESFKMLEENNDRDEDCGYIFELQTPALCSSTSPCVQPSTTSSSTTTSTLTPPTTTSTSSGAPPAPTTTQTSSSPTTTTTSAASSDNSTTTRSSDNPIANKSRWGVFSIVFIVVFSIAVVYLALGTVYLRLVRKARGWEQVPHWYVWHSIGNKSADCCNYICRCGQRQSEVHSYENINDRMSDDDENLLNM